MTWISDGVPMMGTRWRIRPAGSVIASGDDDSFDIIPYLRNRKADEGPEDGSSSALPADEPPVARPAAAREAPLVSEPLSFLKMSDDELRAMEHSEYLRGRLRELKRSLKSGEIDEKRFRMERRR